MLPGLLPLSVRPGIFRPNPVSGRAVTAALVGMLAASFGVCGPAVAAPVAAVPIANPACGKGVTYADPLPGMPWALRRLRPELAWPLSRGAGVTVAVIDSGVSDDHPKLDGAVGAGTDLIQAGGNGTCDEVGHGTYVAGIIAARDTSDAEYYGVAPDARILPVRIISDGQRQEEPAFSVRVAAAINWVVDGRRAKVINLSLTAAPTPQLEAAVASAIRNDIVVVAAAGNEGATPRNGELVFPAAYPGVLAVAGIDEQGGHVSSSNEGDYVSIAAPGLNLFGTAAHGHGYHPLPGGGTSFAAAYVSGTAALVWSYFPNLTGPGVVQRLIATADHPAESRNPQVGYGVVNPYRAVAAILAGTSAQPVHTGPTAMPAGGRTADPLGSVKTAAAWVAAVGTLLAVGGLLSVGVVRRGRARGWRPGRLVLPEELAAPEEPVAPEESEPVRPEGEPD